MEWMDCEIREEIVVERSDGERELAEGLIINPLSGCMIG